MYCAASMLTVRSCLLDSRQPRPDGAPSRPSVSWPIASEFIYGSLQSSSWINGWFDKPLETPTADIIQEALILFSSEPARARGDVYLVLRVP